MTNKIPEDLGSKWSMSDLVLNTLNADGKELHASKHVLATHSSYFEAMFFGADWKEKSSDSLKLDDDYEVVKEVLRILYQLDRAYVSVNFHSPEDLFHLYAFADKYDIPMIRDMCKAELVAQPGVASLGASARLALHDITTEILGAVDLPTITDFVDSIGEGVLCDGEEMRVFLRKSKDHYESLLVAEKTKTTDALKELALSRTSRTEAVESAEEKHRQLSSRNLTVNCELSTAKKSIDELKKSVATLKQKCHQLDSSSADLRYYTCTKCSHNFASRSLGNCPDCYP